MAIGAMQQRGNDQAWKWICLAHATRCLGDRSYTFFLPLFLSSQCTTSALRPTATMTIIQNLAVALLSTKVAKLYSRQRARGASVDMFVKATLLENLAVALGALMIYLAFLMDASDVDGDGDGADAAFLVCSSPLSSSRFRYALFFAAIDAVSK